MIMSDNQEIDACCVACDVFFVPMKGAVGKYCSKACMHQHRLDSRPNFFQCSKCLASVGLGMAVVSRLLRVDKTTISKRWKKEGVKAKIPECGSWRIYAQRRKSKVWGWWGNAETAAMWMSQHKEMFPDWSYLWSKEYAKIKSKQAYRALTSEEKKIRNKRIHELRIIRKNQNPMIKVRDLERIKAWKLRNLEKNKESRIKSIKKRKLNDPGFRVQCNLRHRLKEIMRKVKKGGTEHRNNLTGCSTKQLADHLQSTFKREMTWENYGTRWHVDHIIPCAAFNQTDERQRAQCWHWTNLMALDAQENMDKGDKITEPQMSLLLCATH